MISKKGVEQWISYVLLILFSVVIASLLFVWMKDYATGATDTFTEKFNTEKCAQISISIDDAILKNAQTLYITVTNRNYLRINGILVRIYYDTGPELFEKKKLTKPQITNDYELNITTGNIQAIHVIPYYQADDVRIICDNKKIIMDYDSGTQKFSVA